MSGSKSNGRSRRQMVRLLGKLGDLHPAECRFALLLDDGHVVPCVLVEGDWEKVERQKGRRTLVEGKAVWRMEGPLLRVECDVVASGKGQPKLWSRLPTMPFHVSDLPPSAPSPRPWGWKAIIGALPDDLDEEQVTKALEELS